MVEQTAAAKTDSFKKAAQAKSTDRSRVVSTVQFPYSDLKEAMQVAKKLHDDGGDQAEMAQLAAWLGHNAVDSGAFRITISTARIFGLAVTDGKRVELTPLGRDINDPSREKVARAKAFLSVELYRKIFHRYNGQMLPPIVGLERAMQEMGVSSKQTDKARQAFQRSAAQAGLFEQGQDRLVLPNGVTTKELQTAPVDGRKEDGRKQYRSSGHDGSEPPTSGNGETIRLRSGGGYDHFDLFGQSV